MKKNQKLTPEEILSQVYANSFKFVNDSTLNFIKLYNYKYNMLQQEIIKHEEIEPLKIFKKSHKNWEIKKDKLTIELEKTFNDLIDEYTELENLIEFT